MNLEIGGRIKSLRLERSMTQEQLARKLGVSAQAVSKWESGANAPDIQLLPELSVIFGITIDQLFSITDEKRMERIENSIYDVRFLSQEEFQRDVRYLESCRSNPQLEPEATLLLAMLYNKRAEECHTLAKPLARRALEMLPGRKEAHNAVFDAEHGPLSDWNCINHSELIAFYQDVTRKHPEDIRNYFWLLDALIADGRTAEARIWAEKMKEVEHSYHYEMYMALICKEECDLPGAMKWWKTMTEHSPEKWVVWFQYADAMVKLCRYDEALEFYHKAMDMRPKPRFIDCEEAVAQICLIRGDVAGALEMNRRKLEILREDWTMEGETVDATLREIHRLEELAEKTGEVGRKK